MTNLKRLYRRRLGTMYISLILAGFAVFSLFLDLPVVNKVVLFLSLALVAAIHWDLKDGGLISTFLYSRQITYEVRNFLTSLISFTLVTVILASAQAFYTALVMLYFLPIVLSSLRAGLRISLPLIVGVTSSLGLYYLINYFINGVHYSQQFLYLFLFVSLAAASGIIADRLRKSAVDLSALYETGKALGSLLDEKAILEMVLNIVFMDLAPDAAAIFLVDPKSGALRAQAARGFDDDLQTVEKDTAKNVVKATLSKGAPLLLANFNRRYRLPVKPKMASALSVPIRAADKIIGVLLVCKQEAHGFGFENERFLEALANQAGVSVQNARLYWQTKEWASLDGLTGVHNYRYFTERLDIEWNRAVRYEKPLSLIMIDVDLFKMVNDTHGHLVGDFVLREIASLLSKHTRETDVVARYGGEEFAIILPETHLKDAYLVAEKLRLSVEGASFSGGEENLGIQVTISLGLANYPSTSTSRSDLLYQADQALYRAKSRRNSLASAVDASGSLSLELEKNLNQ